MTKINDDVKQLYYRLDYDDIVQAFEATQKLKTGFGDFLDRCADAAFDDDGYQGLQLADFEDEEIEALWAYYKSRKHAEE